MSVPFRSVASALLLMLVLSTPTPAASWLEQNFWLSGPRYTDTVPECSAGLDWVAARFAQKEGRFWNSDLTILGFEKVRQTAFHPWADSTIPRRFCSAVALVSDGKKRRVDYSISEDTGFIGATWGVTWCVAGLDRNWAYNPNCKMARP